MTEIRLKAIAYVQRKPWDGPEQKSYGGCFGDIVFTAKGDELRVNFYPDFTVTVPGRGQMKVYFETYDRELIFEQEIPGSDDADQFVWKNND